MSIGPSELLFVGVIILVLIFLSRGRKARQARKQQEAEKAEAMRASKVAGQPIRYPELQLLGIVIIVAGVALAGIGYLMTRGVLDVYSIAGIVVAVLGISFVIMARQTASPTPSVQKPATPVAAGKQPQKKISQLSSIDPRIKPEDMADFKKFMALKASSASPTLSPEDLADYNKYMALKSKTTEKS
jgi:hypothetical protein